ncbi:MAG: energy transducer TonB [Gammaproteobacteria bacterium]|nr:energy transducer TonB [Gammaproteobacteria bacterium]
MRNLCAMTCLLSASLLTQADETSLDAATEALEAVNESARQSVPAKTIDRPAPNYPAIELRKGRQAWVHIAYCIDESGKPQNVSVIESVGHRRFERAAIDTVQDWKFEPALLNGKPSWQSRNQSYITFSIDGMNEGADRTFIRGIRKMGKLIENGDLEKADEVFRTLYDSGDLSLYELGKLWGQRVIYETKSGDLYNLDMALHRATASKGEWIDRKSYVQLLQLRIKTEVQLGQYHAAINTYELLVDATGESSDEVALFQPMMERLQKMIDGDQVLRINAEVRRKGECAFCDNSWRFTPVRNSFRFGNIAGSIKSIEMRCDHKRFESAVSDLVEWQIPENWGTCQINVYGEPGTTFDVLMLPADLG